MQRSSTVGALGVESSMLGALGVDESLDAAFAYKYDRCRLRLGCVVF